MGHDYARDHLAGMCGLKIETADAVGDRIFVNGNDAAGLGCVYGGATVAAWYPITPSTSVAEAFAKHCKKYRVDPETRQEQIRHRAVGRRNLRHRHGDRRGLERRARLHRHLAAPAFP